MKAPEIYVFSTLVTQFNLKLNTLHVNLIVIGILLKRTLYIININTKICTFCVFAVHSEDKISVCMCVLCVCVCGRGVFTHMGSWSRAAVRHCFPLENKSMRGVSLCGCRLTTVGLLSCTFSNLSCKNLMSCLKAESVIQKKTKKKKRFDWKLLESLSITLSTRHAASCLTAFESRISFKNIKTSTPPHPHHGCHWLL